MINILYVLIAMTIGAVIGLAVFIYFKTIYKQRLDDIETRKQELIKEGEIEVERIKKDAVLEVKDIRYQAKTESDKEIKEKRYEVTQLEKRLRHKDEILDRKLDQFEKREGDLSKRDKEITKKETLISDKEKEYTKLVKQEREILEKLSGISTEDAKTRLLKEVEEELQFDKAKLIKQIEQDTKDEAEKRAHDIISLAVLLYAFLRR
ncbi:2,3 cyclic-nucleotide 2-phosphodiesterase [Candidatus Magnetoovum chiemensis]|nr:2,3 cyclic-nucleotide 2-phosphodiesterase [Candidatus Magnetoovum chiemensis]